MSYNTLFNFYKTSRILKSQYNYSLEEQNTMIPFERDFFVSMIMQENQEIQNKNKKDQIYDPQGYGTR